MEWNRGPVIGRGSFATVSIATSQNSQTFAVKSAPLCNSHFLRKEQEILSTLNCPHVVGYRGFDTTTENNTQFYNLFMEYAPCGNLLDVIHKHGGQLPHSTIQSYTKSLLLGLNYLHNNGIVHCDIKGQNILVDKQGGAKIADFGCAKLVCGQNESKKIGGTPLFMAPEVARGEQQGFPADVWALGCTVIQMATGKPPWMGFADPASAVYEIGFSDSVPKFPRLMSEEGKDFLGKCFVKDPMKRWSVSELLKHDFISSHQDSNFRAVDDSEFCMSNYRKFDERISKFSAETPTSVFSQSVWESSDSTWGSSSHTASANSPIERVRKLVFSNAELPNWESEADWVTVRSNSTSHSMVSDRHLNDPIVILTHATHNTCTAGCVTTDMARWSCEEFKLAICCNKSTEFRGKCTCNIMTTSGGSRIRCSWLQLLLLCKLITWCNTLVGRNHLMELHLFTSITFLSQKQALSSMSTTKYVLFQASPFAFVSPFRLTISLNNKLLSANQIGIHD